MKKLLIFVPMLAVVAACAKSTSPESPSRESLTPAATAATAATVKVTDNMEKGKILVDASGRTLYTFDNDKNGQIACTGKCAANWPPLLFTGSGQPTGVDGLATVEREGSGKQVTYNGKPLYTYSKDAKAGDVNGDGFAGLWHVVKIS